MLFTLLIFSMGMAQDQNDHSASAIIGNWKTEEGKTVRIYEYDGKYFGKPIDNSGALREQLILKDIEYKGSDWQGRIYAPKREKYYKVVIQMTDEAKIRLKVSLRFVSAEMEWEKEPEKD